MDVDLFRGVFAVCCAESSYDECGEQAAQEDLQALHRKWERRGSGVP